MRLERLEAGESPRVTPPEGAARVTLLGVPYVHLATARGGDLYLTEWALPHLPLLLPESWYEDRWFVTHGLRLAGSGSVYAVPTRIVGGHRLSLVVKFNRVGEDVALTTQVAGAPHGAEFNCPFEEFSLVEQLRRSTRGPSALRLRTQLPLAIYVPPERAEPWQTARSDAVLAGKAARNPEVRLDALRSYVMVYRWLPGVDAAEACARGMIPPSAVAELTARAAEQVAAKGFEVLDMKPAHVIVEVGDEGKLRASEHGVRYGLVDFELLRRL